MVPSFGEWGFILAANYPVATDRIPITKPTKYLDPETALKLFDFEKDLLPQDSLQASTLDRPILLDYYLADWKRWSREKVIY